MSGVVGGIGKKSSSRSVATKTLIIQEYKRRLRDNIRSLNDNFINILNATKINTDDAAHKCTCKMSEYYTIKNEMAVRSALIVRACDELLKLTNDLKEFLILHDFNFLTHAIKTAEEECDLKMKAQMQKHNALRLDVTNLLADIDREIVDHFSFRH
ncbi:surfeit locus protein 5 [Dictyocaulus viviparus]|uniref:Mediator of RNA polymerase II transcription subunit 22 n=1 Tax=Dictyocaulus viviparus TaxID=29172 RepID=A0A0D8YCF4_DICVI|nr:surfeit locus protein 5 [Dictyocaulus viviparus]